ncbi:MAG: tRNA uridine-5-carboxymethylaminomethyl(34) synthesis GTPase MnmE [Bacteroidales bacterium]|nr:tRNA uridine-5-carboxymethylaminomethyl(34) synthesis GTPase MnmE [Bacteroidales bacterium]
MNDTICALATASGGAIGIIRISGPQTLEILSHVFSKPLSQEKPNTIHYGHIFEIDAASGQRVPIDEVMVSIYHAPRSYTGEDSAEVSCHGSRYILNKVLGLLIQNGCRQANPGEFTQRAYLNGKMDLSQAEAVADLIASTNRATHQLAMSQLRGHFSDKLARLRDQLLKLTSLLELELDFSDHEDLEFADRGELLELTKKIDNRIVQLARSFETGQAIKQGIPVAIVGKTNVGKSTLLNQLLKDDRAIVSNIHGTTRDTIEDTIDINGIVFRFIDTAGIRQTSDEVEQIGIERTYQAIDKARIVLWMVDSEPSIEDINNISQLIEGKKLIVIINKIDKNGTESIPSLSSLNSPVIRIAAKYGQGIDTLEQAIYDAAQIPEIADTDIIITNARHYDALLRAHESILRVIIGMEQQLSGDLLAEDLRLTLEHLSEITGGQITPNEVLGNIFKNFCVGK